MHARGVGSRCTCQPSGRVAERMATRSMRACACVAAQAPERYVELDPEMAQALLDQKDSGKQLLLITNRCVGAERAGRGGEGRPRRRPNTS